MLCPILNVKLFIIEFSGLLSAIEKAYALLKYYDFIGFCEEKLHVLINKFIN